MDIANEEGTIATTPTGYSTELSSSIGEYGAQFRSTDIPYAHTPSSLPTRPPPSVSDNVDVNPSHNSHDGIYEIDAYVVPSQEWNEEIIDALNIVPEHQVLEEGKKKKKLFLLGAICIFVTFVLVVIAIVVVTLKKEVNNDGSDSVSNLDQNSTDTPSQAPFESPTTSAFAGFLSTIESLYDGSDQFATVFSNQSSPQYRAAIWVVDTASIAGINGSSTRMISRFSLATFYFATYGDEWSACGRGSTYCNKSQEWLTAANECDWYAIKCNDDDDSSITEIFFPPNGGKSNNIRGTLPHEIAFLSKLAVFIVHKGPISGPFPDWSKLSSLQQVLLNNNQITGKFPEYLVRKNPLLKTIQFNNNRFQGQPLKANLSVDSTSLLDLSLNGNNFTGFIPSHINKLTSLTTLNFGNNGLTGTVPKELYALTNLTKLDLSSTNVHGEISSFIGKTSQLFFFGAGNTEMGGTLPIELFSLSKLQFLNVSMGKFHGSLSESFSELTNLKAAILHNNGFTGTIPDGFERLPFLEKLELNMNDLRGSISEELCDRRGERFKDIKNLTVDCEKVSCSCCTNCPNAR